MKSSPEKKQLTRLAGFVLIELRSHVSRNASVLALLLMTCAGLAFGQNARTDLTGISNRSRALSADQSSAQRAADDTVSLSADKILSFLQKEPGLLLQVKKLLVRKAYEQGRLLESQDLDDEALFRLIREDANVRVLITQEIEDRRYIRAKPSREELERGLVLEPRPRTEKNASQGPEVVQVKNQEDTFWSTHERTVEHNPEPQPYFEQPAITTPTYNPGERGPATPPPVDNRRPVERAQLQPPADELFGGLPSDALAMPRVRPQEMPNLLAASLNDDLSGAPGRSDVPGSEYSPDLHRPLSSLSRSLPDSSLDALSSSRNPSQRDNRLRLPSRPSWTPNNVRDANADQHGLRHRPNPYADVPSLYDLYSQYSGKPVQLERFGLEALRDGTGNVDDLPMDMPVGPEYVLGPGDGLSIDLWGSVAQRLQRVVDRQGRVALPEVGGIEVSGRSLGEAQHLVQSVLRSQFRDVEADVSLSRLRSVRVYVVGDVERPGAYDVSSLSTPLNAVHEAGGPTSRGSLRMIRHYRGKQLLQEVDVYDLFLHGIHSDLKGLQAGDTILVPPLGEEVTVEGMVRRPAIYELGGEKNLAEVLELAGGVLQSGTLRHVDVERVEAHLSRSMLRLDIPEDNKQEVVAQALEEFKVQDGDRIKISPILPYADKTVYLEGHVFRPGKFAYREGMKVTDVIKSYSDLLPEPYKRHAEVIRLNAPDYQPVVLAFNIDDALAGKDGDISLKPFDTIRVFGRFDFEDPPVITVTGAVRDPGDHITNGVTYLRDAVYLAGGSTTDAQLNDAQVFRKTQNGKLKVISVNLSRALAGDGKDNILLEAKDRIFIHRSLAKVDPPVVKIEGEVERPGKYPLGEGMTAADLVRVAGGFKRGAYTELADLTRYEVEHGTNVMGERETVSIGKALAAEPDMDVRLHDGDVLTIRQLSGWNDVGATITVKGEVAHPGTYGIQSGERLSSIIARAGGFQPDAYPYGAIFTRVQVREIEQRNRAELIRQIQDEGTPLKLLNSADADEKAAKEASLMQWKTTLETLQNSPPPGRLVIHISSNMKWASTSADVQVRAGDVIYIPKRPTFVMVDGSVYNPTAISFKPGKSVGWYLGQAGGPSNMANKKAIFVIRADGSVEGGSGGMFSGGVRDAALQPGDMVVVPEKAYSGTTRWKNTLQAAQFATAVGIAVQVARSF